jgi:predicted O-linked N-acetylglucosamine transferase (SPINDLY family)
MTDQELQQLVASNARTIQAMLEQQETSRLQYESHRLLYEEQMNEFRQAMLRLARVEEGLINMVVSLDEDRPTVLRKLTSIENKVDRILEKDN